MMSKLAMNKTEKDFSLHGYAINESIWQILKNLKTNKGVQQQFEYFIYLPEEGFFII